MALNCHMYRKKSIAVIIPALNEEPSIGKVIKELSALGVCGQCGYADKEYPQNESNSPPVLLDVKQCESCCKDTKRDSLVDHIVVCDNGSTDKTAEIAEACGAHVVAEQEKGYGAACLAAINFPLERDIVVFVDGDHSVVCAELPDLLDPLFSGADLVIGSRTLGVCESGALSTPQIMGNRLASAMMRLLWKQRVTDLGPFRAISNQALIELGMQDRQFGWTVEMQVRALQLKKQVVEIPVTTRTRIGKSKIGGTVSGVIGASKGILGTIVKLYYQELSDKYRRPGSMNSANSEVVAARDKQDTL